MNTVAQLIDRYLTARAEIRGTQRGSLARIAKGIIYFSPLTLARE